MIAREVDFRHMHDLGSLLSLLEETVEIVPEAIRTTVSLTTYATTTRFPNAGKLAGEREYREAIAIAGVVARLAEERLRFPENVSGWLRWTSRLLRFEVHEPERDREVRRNAILDGDTELQTLDATALDRVHAAMLLQASGHANALRALTAAEQDRGPDFLRLGPQSARQP